MGSLIFTMNGGHSLVAGLIVALRRTKTPVWLKVVLSSLIYRHIGIKCTQWIQCESNCRWPVSRVLSLKTVIYLSCLPVFHRGTNPSDCLALLPSACTLLFKLGLAVKTEPLSPSCTAFVSEARTFLRFYPATVQPSAITF